jgi:hypothetical protein
MSKTILAKVMSSNDPSLFYTTTNDSCSCPSGFWRPDVVCKHREKLEAKTEMPVIFGDTSAFSKMASSSGDREYLTQVGSTRSCTCPSGFYNAFVVCRHQKALQGLVDSVAGVEIIGQI